MGQKLQSTCFVTWRMWCFEEKLKKTLSSGQRFW